MIDQLMQRLELEPWGICSYSRVLPLLPVRSRSRIPENSQSVIVMLFGYYIGEYTNRNVSRYAIVDDYHTVIRQKLDILCKELQEMYINETFIPFVDSSPVAEVRAAHLAGLGDVGLNGQLLSPIYGSYCFIGEVVTTLALPFFEGHPPHICTRCGRCIQACPTGALSPQGFEQARCRSYLTQKKGELSQWEQEQVRAGGFVWGCDRCTDACPVNRNAQKSRIAAFYRDIVSTVGEDNVEKLCGTKAYGWRGENVLLRNLHIISGEDVV